MMSRRKRESRRFFSTTKLGVVTTMASGRWSDGDVQRPSVERKTRERREREREEDGGGAREGGKRG